MVTEEKVHSNLYKVEKARKLFKPGPADSSSSAFLFPLTVPFLVVTPSYLVDAVEKGRIVDAEVMELDGLVNPPNPAKARVVADAELEVGLSCELLGPSAAYPRLLHRLFLRSTRP